MVSPPYPMYFCLTGSLIFIGRIDCIHNLSINPYIHRFASGKTRSNVRFRDVLETKYIFDKEKHVTDYIVDCIDKLAIIPTTSSSSQDTNNKSINDFSTSSKVFNDNTLSDNDYVIDENSDIAGNSVATRGPQDPPSMTKFRRRTSSAENSYSTYPRKVVSPPISIPRDPP